jgi:hypothetical protein
MCFSFSFEAAGMVASMRPAKTGRVASKVRRGGAPQEFRLSFLPFTKKHRNYEEQPFERT